MDPKAVNVQDMAPNKRGSPHYNFVISSQKHMLWVGSILLRSYQAGQFT